MPPRTDGWASGSGYGGAGGTGRDRGGKMGGSTIFRRAVTLGVGGRGGENPCGGARGPRLVTMDGGGNQGRVEKLQGRGGGGGLGGPRDGGRARESYGHGAGPMGGNTPPGAGGGPRNPGPCLGTLLLEGGHGSIPGALPLEPRAVGAGGPVRGRGTGGFLDVGNGQAGGPAHSGAGARLGPGETEVGPSVRGVGGTGGLGPGAPNGGRGRAGGQDSRALGTGGFPHARRRQPGFPRARPGPPVPQTAGGGGTGVGRSWNGWGFPVKVPGDLGRG